MQKSNADGTRKEWKGCPPRVSRICIVDDDDDCQRQKQELIESEFPKLTVYSCDSIFAAYRGVGRFDYVIIDVSAVAPMMMGDVRHAYAPIVKFMENYSATEIIITSAMSKNSVDEVIEEIVHAGGNAKMVHYGGTGQWDALKAKLHELIKPIDMEWTKVKSKRQTESTQPTKGA